MNLLTDYHIPALLHQSIEGLKIKPNGVYIDVTFGGGGHSREILNKLDKGKLIAFDKDKDAIINDIDDKRFTLVNHDFIYLKNFLQYLNAIPVDGIIADLGVSSHQFDTAERGFSYRFDADLDMRMDSDFSKSAFQLLNESSETELKNYFFEYGEIHNAGSLAKKVVEERSLHPLKTTTQLLAIIKKQLNGSEQINKYAGLVFQALRISVNDEINALKQLLIQSKEVLATNGRMVIISYHSLEDRVVKNFFKSGNFEGIITKDLYGNYDEAFNLITKKAIVPKDDEIYKNNRARSARLRIAEKL
jgi:16S rRNA (cytosine1402-N4)-methyltransferase